MSSFCILRVKSNIGVSIRSYSKAILRPLEIYSTCTEFLLIYPLIPIDYQLIINV
jgi:hypothetical protein